MRSQAKIVALAFLLTLPWATKLLAEDSSWTKLNADQVRTALSGRILQYEAAWQDFRPSGRTLYNAGSESWGYWRIEGDKYCSQWPPTDLWVCYDVEAAGDKLRFVGPSDDVTEAVYAD